MVNYKIYECKLCNLVTRLKTDYNRHKQTRKHQNNVKKYEYLCNKKKNEPKMNPCDFKNVKNEPKMNPNEPKIKNIKLNYESSKTNEKRKIYKCLYCEKHYTTNSHMNRHMKTCKLKDKYNNKDNKSLINYIKKIEKQQEILKNKIENIIVNTTNTINNTINMQNIYINNYGNENLDYLTKGYLNGLVYKPYNSVQCLVKRIHFDPNHPENHNIKIPSEKKNLLQYLQVLNGN